jgi:hypothetical protein
VAVESKGAEAVEESRSENQNGEGMKFYHFTATHLLPAIQREGLTKGVIPIIRDGKFYGFVGPCQWLTSNGSFVQDWQTHSHLPYRRNAVRLTIKIPKSHMDKVVPWSRLDVPSHEVLDVAGDPENWMVFDGHIPAGWIREVVKNNEEAACTNTHSRTSSPRPALAARFRPAARRPNP